MARPERFELPTFWFVARHSIQLSYGRSNRRSNDRCRFHASSAARCPDTPLGFASGPAARLHPRGVRGSPNYVRRSHCVHIAPHPTELRAQYSFSNWRRGRDYSSLRSSPFGPPSLRGRVPCAGLAGSGSNPRSWWLRTRQSRSFDRYPFGAPLERWRRGRDSNPRRAFNPYSLSRGALSTTQPPLRTFVFCLIFCRSDLSPVGITRRLRLLALRASIASRHCWLRCLSHLAIEPSKGF